ncbi:MAG: ABC transporter ATP-binding protein [Phototrophicaceae bacterium]
MTSQPIISLQHILKRYDGVTAVRDVSLTVLAGERLVLLGPSGCGKTTLLRLIAGLERPDEGQITLNGALVAAPNVWIPPEVRRVAMVFQDYALFPHQTTEQNVMFGMRTGNGHEKRTRADAMLARVGLGGYAGRYPHQLSGGQQQRVAVARALAAEPAVVLLDEPFSNLDAALRRDMREDIRSLLEDAHATAVFVTHDQEEALSLADRVAVMDAGRIEQIGTPAQIYLTPVNRAVATFVGEANFIPGHADGATVTTALGKFRLVRASSGAVDVLLRPEALTVTTLPNGNATLTDIRFFGHYQRLQLRLDDDTPLTGRAWAHLPYTVGERVQVTVNGDVVGFAKEA